MKFCKDCSHSIYKAPYNEPKCGVFTYGEPDMVSGRINYFMCSSARENLVQCGGEAKMFSPLPPLERFINRFCL